MSLVRLNDFVPGTTILSGQIDAELDQLVQTLNGVKDVDVLHKLNHASNPVLNLNQLNTNVGALLIKGQQNSVDTFKAKANGYIVGYRRVIRSSVINSGNVGAGLDTLDSYDLPANSLPSNSDSVRVIYYGTFASNDNNKRLALTVGPTLCLDTGLIDLDQQGFTLLVNAHRLSSTSIQLNFNLLEGFVSIDSAGAISSNGSHYRSSNAIGITVSDLASNVLNFLVQGEGTSDNDISINAVEVSVLQMT